ncbi:MAG TPA: serine/threonine-protein kinase PknK, partial [Byssovorax sp.]
RQSRFTGEEELCFRHALLRDAAYATLTEHDRAFGHRAAGAWLVAAGEQDPLVLAEHFERGGEAASAVAQYLRAAEQALAGSDLVGTSAIVDRAFASGRDGIDGETRGRLLALEAEANAWGGDFARAEVVGLEAMSLLRPGSGPWCAAASAIVLAVGPQNDVARLERTLAPLDHATPDEDGIDAYANLLVICAVRFLTAGMQGPAAAICARIDAERARSDHPYIVAGYAITSGYRALLAGDHYTCLVAMRFAEEKLFELGHRRYATTAITLTGVVLTQLGAHELAEAAFARASHLTTSMAMRSFMPMVLHNRGLTLLRLGRLDDALAVELEATRQTERAYPGLRRSCHNYLAKIHLAAGRLDDAAREAARATAPDLPGARGPLAHALATEALVAVARGEIHRAVALARRAHALLDDIGVISEGEPVVRLALVEALLAAGQRAEAAVAVAHARAALLARAATIGEPDLARSFLEAVPEHARTLAVARALVG